MNQPPKPTPTSRVVIARRYNGPPESGNGGYSAGVLGALMGESAEVTLRRPPPLDVPLTITRNEGGLHLHDGDVLIAEARSSDPGVEPPQAPSVEAGESAERHFIGFKEHPFPTCFVCGPKRAPGDGLRLFTGPAGRGDIVAARWTPEGDLGGADGLVEPRIVWAALDCPSYFGGQLAGYPPAAVLGRLTVKRIAPVRLGAPHVVVGWPLAHLGRKWEGASAVFTANGELCAIARGLWIELKAKGA
jgi:hypothetical protein